ncbi:hypothetical protein CN285_25630 [Bacillus cereus]|uniref:DUF4430 domain-containing protein n=1 Tax=Bacillus paramycoides TaxID=2026194 RepID=UPI000BF2B25A|nr:DUF4430 domain-containing protein [Bacillus paramycoides]PFD34293.1 hypothetical protein CN285_25630 [Bacillus cereus]
MSKMKWFISLFLSLGLLAGCEQTAVKPEKKAEPKQEEQKEVAKQEEQKDETKPEEKQTEPEQKQQEEQKDKQEQKEEKVQEQPEVKKEEKPKEQPAANKQPEQQKVQEEKQQPKAPEVKEEAKVVNQPKETPKQEQKVDPNKGGKDVTVPELPKPVPPNPPEPPKPQAKQVTISVKGHEGYLLGAKKVDVQEGDTVYSVLQSTGLDVDAMGSKDGIYVKGINDLYEKDITATSGWKYRVNGAFPNYSAGVVKVKPGDTIEWVFVLK